VISLADEERVNDVMLGAAIGLWAVVRETLVLEKLASVYTSRDHAIAECGLAARKAVARAGRFDAAMAEHVMLWKQLWSRFDMRVQPAGTRFALNVPMLLRLNMFHSLQAASPNSIGLDVGVPARGWTGEAYQGHIFWDKIFIFPFLNYRIPEITRSLLMYRYRRLGEARAAAKSAEFQGYPGSPTPGLSNNAYTSVMAVWVLCRAKDVLEVLPNVRRTERLELSPEETARWDDISRRMFVPFHGDGIISQFEGYEQLAESDIQQGTAAEGIHLGAMAGTVDLVQRALTGIEVSGDVLRLNPRLPEEVERLDMRIRYRGHSLDLRVTRDTLTVRGRDRGAAPIQLAVRGETYEFAGDDTRNFRLGSVAQ